ncbi:cellulose binding domain-containing protein [Dactylosporangium fulvum]|uniref:Cellulose binding domain-containing protein n=1 Tax=Dactylosporangium fulvum TaxID=53359 RepID=A0ABY5VWV7_9ACTN|nr:cellulose binding domain-containing protein [Dactylosporangium fulvum]UWP82105.1 cellulose binding domain-containing protein [Dactylosporangium fulvum]
MRLRIGVIAAALATAAATVIIATPAFAAPATASFVRTSSWGTGYEAKYTITNGTTSTINGWTVAFDLPSGTAISSSWDANRTGTTGRVTFTNSWNGTIPPGGTASFGFVASGNGDPANCTFNGASCAGGTNPGTPSAPTNLQVTATTNTSLALAWSGSSGTVTGYRVYEGTAVRATLTGTTTTISGLAAGSTHTYTVKAYNAQGESAASNSVTATTTGGTTNPPSGWQAAPYLYQWGDQPNPQTVQAATGIRWFTLAFVLSGGGCTPAWDGNRPLTGGIDQTVINQVRAGGGDVIPSFGGWSGNKLGPNCSTPQALANAYQQVINTYNLKAIDIDIENTDEFENDTVRNRIVDALKIVKQNNPNLKTIITFGTSTTGPGYYAQQLITRAAQTGANIDVFTIMPFDFGGGANMYQSTVSASEGLKNTLKSAFGWDDATAYRHMGISGMNGLSDQQELTSVAYWQQIRDYAQTNHLARLAFWSVNRDRPCPGGGVVSNCSGIAQNNWQFTQITASFTG